MTEEPTDETLNRIRFAADNILRADRYMLRRAWGIYYATWATAILLFEVASIILNYISNPLLGDIFFGIVFTTVGITALYETGRIFSKVSKVEMLQKFLKNGSKSRLSIYSKIRDYNMIFMFLLILALVLISFSTHFQFLAFFFIALILLTFGAFALTKLDKAFNHRIPWEGKLAIGVYLFSDIIGASLTIITGNGYWWFIFWIPVIITWYAAALFSILYARKEKEARNLEVGEESLA